MKKPPATKKAEMSEETSQSIEEEYRRMESRRYELKNACQERQAERDEIECEMFDLELKFAERGGEKELEKFVRSEAYRLRNLRRAGELSTPMQVRLDMLHAKLEEFKSDFERFKDELELEPFGY